MERITIGHLRAMVKRVNTVAGTPLEAYTKQPDKTFKANIGHIGLDCAYGGYRVIQLVSEGGGETEFGPGYRMNARECYYTMRGIESAFEYAKRRGAQHV